MMWLLCLILTAGMFAINESKRRMSGDLFVTPIVVSPAYKMSQNKRTRMSATLMRSRNPRPLRIVSFFFFFTSFVI